jgi:RND family efflux transporter MFP subunit
VQEGDMLFILDKKPFEQRLAAANGMLAEAKAALKKYEADVARLTPLAKAKAVPQQDLDNALASVDVGKANVLSAEARVQAATIDLGYCEVKAPVTGLIGAKQVSIGELVGKGQATLLATISTLDPIWFYCNISEVQYRRAASEVLRTGFDLSDLPVTLLLEGGYTHTDKGKLVFIDRAVDPKTGTMRARAEFKNALQALRPGMFGRIKIDVGVRTNSLMVPERAITELQGKFFAWVVGSDNQATQCEVKVGEQFGNSLVIPEGLKAGERIVVEGLQKIRKGEPVQPMTAAQLAEMAKQTEAKAAEAHAAEAKSAEGKPAKGKSAKE